MKKKVQGQSVMLDLIKSNLGYEHKFYKAEAKDLENREKTSSAMKRRNRNFIDENKSTYASKKVSERQLSRNTSGNLLLNSNINKS